jgi:acylphosphatase
MQNVVFKVIFQGIVQGVGFRQSVNFVAQKYKLMGYVRNLDDLTVEMKVITKEQTLLKLIEEIKIKAKAATIENIHIQKEVSSEVFKPFYIHK